MNVCDDKSFYERILQSHKKNNKIKVLEVSKELDTSKGDNFLSKIYRIFIKYTNNEYNNNINTNEETSLIFKMKLDNVSLSETINKAFSIESNVFKNILTKIENYVQCSIAPHFYYTDDDSNYIVMEDLVRSGYIIENKLKGLNFQQCHKVIEKMAKFHAGSVLIAETVRNFKIYFNINILKKYILK